MPTLHQVPTPLDSLPTLWIPRQVAAFAQREAARLDLSKRPADPPGDIASALARLDADGLVAKVTKRPRLMIVGGTSPTPDTTIPGFQDGFVISLETEGTFFTSVAGPGNHARESEKGSLSEAVEAVLAVYRERRSAAGSARSSGPR